MKIVSNVYSFKHLSKKNFSSDILFFKSRYHYYSDLNKQKKKKKKKEDSLQYNVIIFTFFSLRHNYIEI